MTEPSLPFPHTLDGVHLNGVDTTSWEIDRPTLKRVRQAANGARREAYAYNGIGKAMLRTSLMATFEWATLGKMAPVVEELLAIPGPHQLVLWRRELATFAGGGSRVEWTMPWVQAVDVITALPSGVLPERFAPTAKVGRTGDALTCLTKNDSDYGTGDPSTGEAWFLEGGKTFKLSAAPALGEYVYVWIVPVFEVFDSGENPKKFSDPLREPRRVVLMER